MNVSMEEYERVVDLVGEQNASILINRAAHFQEGLEFSVRVSRDANALGDCVNVIGPWKQEIMPPNTKMRVNFLDAMKEIEEEFISGKRKRIGE